MVKTKFKHTDIGLIPENWEVVRLDELSCKNGLIRGPFGGALKKQFFVKEGYKVYEQKNAIYRNIDLGSYYISEAKFKELQRFEIQQDDFILSCSGTIGKIYKIPKYFKRGIINQALLLIRLNRDVIDYNFFNFIFNETKIQNKIIDDTQGGAMKNLIGMSEFKKLQIPLPPFAEQQAIVEVLSDTDRWIESIENLITKKQLIKQGAMQKLLTPKEGWEVKKLGDCLDYIQPTPFLVKSADYNSNNNIPVLTAGKTFILGYTSETAGIFNNLPTIIFDDFTTASKYVDFPFKAKSSAMKMLILKNNDSNLKYLSYSMMSLKFQVGDHKRHWIREFQNIEIPLPPIAEQNQIASILSDMDAEIEILEQKLAKAQQIKQGLMRELLTGKIRLVISQVKKEIKPLKKHNNHFNDAVLIGVMASCLGSENFPLTRFRYTKVSYLLKRYKDEQITEYLKKAAGPYNPKTRYGGAEKIAIENKYVAIKKRSYKGKEYEGFLEAENIEQALGYFNRWYGEGALNFIKQFKYETNNNLELLATVDMAIQDLKEENKEINLNSIKQFIRENEEWRDKLNRSAFCDENIEIAIKRLDNLYN
ncbi:restriction endonuclease subunit S [Capnocytophaga sp. H2931]|uniref:restriction endonuclease subunit S n=1 Tax=Capnocytophaga sp. H2931 TaxID=1945657 RepID=UPI000BB199C8|nr:restriction endonuclease subunit S [Capnocytophaga sp. H2931]ATA75741.1 type I restriction endonuclease subunit S [Capnocytophaga sp. H2931]